MSIFNNKDNNKNNNKENNKDKNKDNINNKDIEKQKRKLTGRQIETIIALIIIFLGGIYVIFTNFDFSTILKSGSKAGNIKETSVTASAGSLNTSEAGNLENNSSGNSDSDDNSSDKSSSDDYNSNDSSSENLEKENDVTNQVNLVMVGDVLLHTPVSDSGLKDDGSYNYDPIFTNVKNDIESADVALANQEVILGGKDIGLTGYPAFNGAFEVGDALVNAGFDVILHATNHALDRGSTGITNCLNFWKTNYPEISVIGINENQQEQDSICIKEINGIKIAFLNYTYGTNGISLPTDMPYAVNLIDRDKIAKDLSIAEGQADFTVVCPHWGIEYTHEENADQVSLAEFMISNGADLIIGTHPHVIQPVEWVQTDNGNKGLVYYSLGNFVNSTSDYGEGVADRMVGAMANITIQKDKTSDETIISDYSVTPLVTQLGEGYGGITTYKLSDYNESIAGTNLAKEHDSNFSIEYCRNLCNEVFGDVKQN